MFVEEFLIVPNKSDGAIRQIAKSFAFLSRPAPTRIYVNYAWQSGDFAHFYAAIISDLFDNNINRILFVVFAEQAVKEGIMSDIRFALKSLAASVNKTVHVLIVQGLDKGRITNLKWADLGVAKEAVIKADGATRHASNLVKTMQPGQPLTVAWTTLARGNQLGHDEAYAAACAQFSEQFFADQRFAHEDFSGTAKFVCLWDRTVPLMGGANPQYNSTQDGNQQLCQALIDGIPDLKAVLLVGTDFNGATKSMRKAFNLGEFWEKFAKIKGRFQENGFFDYMTALYNCDVVHLGMKSGGLDTLGLWGQKVLFIDSDYAHWTTRERVAQFTTARFRSIAVETLPSRYGKAIQAIRIADRKACREDSIKTTIPKSLEARVEEIAAPLDNKFAVGEVGTIVTAVARLFG